MRADGEQLSPPGGGGRGQALGGTDGARGMRRRSKSLSDYAPAPARGAAKLYGLVGSRSVGGGLASARLRVGAASDLFTLVTPPGGTPRAGGPGGGDPGLSPTAAADASALSSRRASGASAGGEPGDGGEGGAGGCAPGGVRRLLSRKLSGNRCEAAAPVHGVCTLLSCVGVPGIRNRHPMNTKVSDSPS